MPQVIVGENAEELAAAGRMPGQLEVDEGRVPAIGYQDIGFLGKIIVCDAPAMQLAQEAHCAPVILRVPGSCAVHRCTFKVFPLQSVPVHANESGHADETVQRG